MPWLTRGRNGSALPQALHVAPPVAGRNAAGRAVELKFEFAEAIAILDGDGDPNGIRTRSTPEVCD